MEHMHLNNLYIFRYQKITSWNNYTSVEVNNFGSSLELRGFTLINLKLWTKINAF